MAKKKLICGEIKPFIAPCQILNQGREGLINVLKLVTNQETIDDILESYDKGEVIDYRYDSNLLMKEVVINFKDKQLTLVN